uniref:Putative GTPase, CobW/HypB/UreG, nucleotide-binding domain, with Cobalamin synthesis protein cobW C-terminal domain n=1 Tax=Magnetococcus massalia (strain MO-1) TaxID=451514 RepID=A0A1S7LFK4_MAGMO|nr:Putative GTPase, CobW/HypB/UreG, nucleotide-binding domain, with Cobalamin synthesis protein cobW C-terminal domain [Candidatus Magnetococcus massalia]
MVSPMLTPVSVLTGFLGSGKTTLLNHLLQADHALRIAVIINEFGEIGMDEVFVMHAEEDLFEMNNGCVCCSVRGDLIEALKRIAEQPRRVDHVLLETTGLATPGPIAQTFLQEEGLKQHFVLDGFITLVDALHLPQQLPRSRECQAQVAFADRLLLNKVDLVEPVQLQQVEQLLSRYNSHAPRLPCERGKLPVEQLFGLGGFDGSRMTPLPEQDHHGHHDQEVQAICFSFPGSLDGALFVSWLTRLLELEGDDLYRMKGELNLHGHTHRHLFQGVHRVIEGYPGEAWGDEERLNRFVFIGKGLNRALLEQGFQDCLIAQGHG